MTLRQMFCYTGVEREEELLKGLLTDDYCHVCEAVLLFESQRLSHYEVCAVTERVIVILILWLYDDYVSYKPPPPPPTAGKETRSETQGVPADEES